jgi:hypothetical protein
VRDSGVTGAIQSGFEAISRLPCQRASRRRPALPEAIARSPPISSTLTASEWVAARRRAPDPHHARRSLRAGKRDGARFRRRCRARFRAGAGAGRQHLRRRRRPYRQPAQGQWAQEASSPAIPPAHASGSPACWKSTRPARSPWPPYWQEAQGLAAKGATALASGPAARPRLRQPPTLDLVTEQDMLGDRLVRRKSAARKAPTPSSPNSRADPGRSRGPHATTASAAMRG